MRTGPLIRSLGMGMVVGGLLAGGMAMAGKDHQQPLAEGAVADAIVVDKASRTLTLFQDGAPLKTYPVSFGKGGLGPKTREGDGKTPDGTYHISGRNPKSGYHLSLRISYPNAADRAAAEARGESPGGDIMIHGLKNGMGWLGVAHRQTDWTAGCIAVTDEEMDELWRTIPDGTPITIRGVAPEPEA